MTNVRETRRADELKVGDWLRYDENGALKPNEVVAVFQYPTGRGPRIHLTTQVPGRDPYSSDGLPFESTYELVSEDELAALREQAERAQKIADIRALADWLEANPFVPMPYAVRGQATVERNSVAGVVKVREMAKRLGKKADESLDDRTCFDVKFGEGAEVTIIAWHENGRPALVDPYDSMKGGVSDAEEFATDPTGLTYTRADDEPDDPTPVSGARVPAHTGGVTEGGLAEEVIRYFSFGHGQTDPADDSGKDLVCHYVTVIAPTAEACREAMLASRFGREWAFEYVPGTPQANEWIPQWTEYERIDAMPKAVTDEGLVDETERKVHFGRDPFGLLARSACDLELAKLPTDEYWTEVGGNVTCRACLDAMPQAG